MVTICSVLLHWLFFFFTIRQNFVTYWHKSHMYRNSSMRLTLNHQFFFSMTLFEYQILNSGSRIPVLIYFLYPGIGFITSNCISEVIGLYFYFLYIEIMWVRNYLVLIFTDYVKHSLRQHLFKHLVHSHFSRRYTIWVWVLTGRWSLGICLETC